MVNALLGKVLEVSSVFLLCARRLGFILFFGQYTPE